MNLADAGFRHSEASAISRKRRSRNIKRQDLLLHLRQLTDPSGDFNSCKSSAPALSEGISCESIRDALMQAVFPRRPPLRHRIEAQPKVTGRVSSSIHDIRQALAARAGHLCVRRRLTQLLFELGQRRLNLAGLFHAPSAAPKSSLRSSSRMAPRCGTVRKSRTGAGWHFVPEHVRTESLEASGVHMLTPGTDADAGASFELSHGYRIRGASWTSCEGWTGWRARA